MDVPCDVPDLLNIFTKIVCDRKQYCFVCLRTSDERRLVKPEQLEKFMAATKVNTNSNAQFVCHICERQASNALKLFRAALFASSLSLILTELCKRGITDNKMMLEAKYFRRILNKVELSKNLTPQAINEEVRLIRNNNLLLETDTLVMDNKQIYEAAPTPTVVAITTGQADVNNTEALHEALSQCPIQPILQQIPQRCSTPSILPDRDVSQDAIIQNNILPPQESYVILDDEDDPLSTTNSTNPQNVSNVDIPVNQNIMTTVANLNNNLVITSNPPNIVRFEDLVTQSNVDQSNFLLHPILLSEDGILTVPSLSAVIMNGLLLFQDHSKEVTRSTPLKVNTDIVKRSLNRKEEVFLQNCNNFQLPAMNSNLVNLVVDKNCQSDFSTYPQKKMKIDGSILNNLLTKDKNVGGTSRNTETMDEVLRAGKAGDGKTDWEDKIPMDVISFMDAVDPNADAVLKDMHLRNVRSLVRPPEGDMDVVIDLC